jgi:RNA-binding protein
MSAVYNARMDPDDLATAPPCTPLELTGAQRRELRARAHALDPLVRVGDAGLTDAVVTETDRALTAHGLVKVRVFGDDRGAREAIATRLVERLGCALVQSIGKLLVLWRPIAAPAAPAATPIRRRAPAVPKKLAAQGRTAPRRPSSPARATTAGEAVPSRRPPSGRRAGPGMRTSRGALDAGARPRGAPAADATSGASRRNAPRTGAAPARGAARDGGAARTGARPSTPRGAGAARGGSASRGRAPARGGAPSGGGAQPRSGAATRRPNADRGVGGTRSSRIGPTARPAGRPTPGAGPVRTPAPRRGSAGSVDSAVRASPARRGAGTSPARPPSASPRRGAGSVTGSARPAPRTRGGRRGR